MAGGEASRSSRIALGVLVAVAPAIATCLLVAELFNATLFEYLPNFSDEIAYQRQIAAFVRAGFESGYFGFYERPAPLEASHFSVHGPAFPVIYGLLGKVFGWHFYSGPVFNLGVLAVATAVFLMMGRLSRSQIIAAGVVLLTSWWVLLMASTTMQESLNQAVMIVIAGCVARLLHPDTQRHGVLLAAALVLLVIASVLRPTNWIVAVPLVLVGMSWQRPLRLALATAGAMLGIPVFWLIWRYVSAPIPGLAIEWASATGAGALGRIATYFVDQVGENVEKLFAVAALLEAPFYVHVMFESAAFALVCGWLVVRALLPLWSRRGRQSGAVITSLALKVDVFNLLALGTALVAFLGFYFDSDASISRVTAPFLLLSLLVLVATRCRRWMVAAAIVANLLVAPSFVVFYRAWRVDLFRYADAPHQVFRAQLAPWLRFDPGKTPWCNTLLTTAFQRELVSLPDGIGFSIGRPPNEVAPPIKSGYLLLTPDTVEEYRRKVRLQHLTATALGELYANLDAACP